MKYFVMLNGQQTGPVDENQLPSLGVTRDTMVWHEGMAQWQAAGNLPELSYMFAGNQGNNQGGYNQGQGDYNQGGYNQGQGGYNQGGYNQGQGGYNQGGYNQGGYNQGGYNQGQGGYNQGGYNQGSYQGYNQGGYNQGYNQGMPPCPKTYLVESILVTLFCCLPFGIVSIINAAGVSQAYSAGNYQEALDKSEKAKKWAMIGLIVGIVVSVIYFFIILAAEL